MITFDLIPNPRLRELVQQSKSIQSLDEERRQAMLERIVKLPPEGQAELLKVLEEEAAAYASGKVLTTEAKEKMLKEGTKALVAVKRDLSKQVLAEGEKVEMAKSDLAATQLLQQL